MALLRSGSRGDEVRDWQTFLASQGYDVGPIDGIFGAKTKAAVLQFQTDVGSTADGIIGPETTGFREGIESGETIGEEVIDDQGEIVLDDPAPMPEDDANAAPGAVGSVTDETGATITPGIAPGGTLTKVTRAGQDDLWGMTYTVQGIQHVYTFDSLDTMKRALGDDAIESGTFGFLTLDESQVNDGDTWLLGDAAAFVGRTESYNTFYDDLMQEAALEAGVRNPGRVGQYLSNPDVQRIMVEGEAGSWSSNRIQAELRNTSFYQNELYPGISTFLIAGEPNPEQSYLRYVSDVSQSLSMLGYEKDEFGSYRDVVGEMLDSGIRADDFNAFAPTFVRAEQSQDFADVLNQWTERDLGKSISFEDWFDVLEGNSSADVAAVVEKAQLSFASENVGTTLDPETISRLASLTQFSEAQMAQAFTGAEEALLAVGNANLERFGLSQEALVSSAFGVESQQTDPLSTSATGFTAVEVRRRARKAATELGLEDDRKASFFVGFSPSGAPQRRGLGAGAPESG